MRFLSQRVFLFARSSPAREHVCRASHPNVDVSRAVWWSSSRYSSFHLETCGFFLLFPFCNSFAQDDLKGVAQRLEAMVKSMDVLKDMPEAEDRAATLRELQERLETLLKPKLLEVSGFIPFLLVLVFFSRMLAA